MEGEAAEQGEDAEVEVVCLSQAWSVFEALMRQVPATQVGLQGFDGLSSRQAGLPQELPCLWRLAGLCPCPAVWRLARLSGLAAYEQAFSSHRPNS